MYVSFNEVTYPLCTFIIVAYLHNIAMVRLHHNHIMSISYHKNGLVCGHQSVSRWLIFFINFAL